MRACVFAAVLTSASLLAVTSRNAHSAASAADALSVDVNVSTHSTAASGSFQSPAFSTNADAEVLLAFVSSDGPNATASQSFTSVDGAGLSWTLRQRSNGQAGTAEIWQAVTTSALSDVAVTATQAESGYQGSITVVSFSGADTSAEGAVASADAVSGAPAVTLTTTHDNSWVWGVGKDWDQAVARTLPDGQTLDDQYIDDAVGDTYWTQYADPTPAAGTDVVLNDTTPTDDRWDFAAVEVVPASGAPTATDSSSSSAPTQTSSSSPSDSSPSESATPTDSGTPSDSPTTPSHTSTPSDTTTPSATTSPSSSGGGSTGSTGSTASIPPGTVPTTKSSAPPTTTASAPTGPHVVFKDEFAGTALGSAWTVISRHGEYSQDETECNEPQQVSVADDVLSIATVAKPTSCGDFNVDGSVRHAASTWPYATGDVQWAKTSFTYGTVSIRAKVPAKNTSTWPALWLLGSNCQKTNPYTADTGYSSCPEIGTEGYVEIDMTECYTTHWCQLALAQNDGFPICNYSPPTDTNWHTFTMVWTKTAITELVDGESTGCSFTAADGFDIPSTPMFLIMQTQTGGVSGTPANLPTSFDIASVTVTQP